MQTQIIDDLMVSQMDLIKACESVGVDPDAVYGASRYMMKATRPPIEPGSTNAQVLVYLIEHGGALPHEIAFDRNMNAGAVGLALAELVNQGRAFENAGRFHPV